ncbi:hypothetical protein [Agromyces sp. Marseille-P2726]|uniref:hypothetical protein n=1 Tax=Agromyces sp. Marseille-P2726 TaxID=2709132 RepID=UPI0015709F6C|nr:hypothetical protein [Agromyces sp. Marseille-P2726]
MSDELTVSGSGSSMVAIDELFVDAARLAATESVVASWRERAGVIRRGLELERLPRSAQAWHTGSPMAALEEFDRVVAVVKELAVSLRAGLLQAAEQYGATERLVGALWTLGAAFAAPFLGFAAPSLLLGGALAAAGQGAGSHLWRALGWGATPLERWLVEHRDLLSDPLFVRFVRLAADHADEFGMGAAHVPLPAPFISAIGSGVGAPESASMLLGTMGALGVLGSRAFVDGPVRVDRAAGAGVEGDRGVPVRPPTGVGDLARRVPSGGDGSAQIRVERYGTADDPRWIVYVGGTVEVGLVAGEQPMDMTSNTHGVADDTALDLLRLAGADSGAGERATREALRQAGMQPGDPLLAVGYSGGGVIAAKLAADPELGAVGAVNLGGPVASAPTRDDAVLLSIEHEEDLVPAVGGAGHPSDQRLTVTRSVLEADRTYDGVLPAHELERYRETAALVDRSDEQRVAAFRELVGEITRGVDGEGSEWVATREVSPVTGAPRAR